MEDLLQPPVSNALLALALLIVAAAFGALHRRLEKPGVLDDELDIDRSARNDSRPGPAIGGKQ